MTLSTILGKELDKWHLLKHPYYQLWNEGKLTLEDLCFYAKEYYPHVYRFPQYLSAAHANCEKDIKTRQILLANLIDEEHGENNHPELWLRFAEGLGVNRSDMSTNASLPSSQELADQYGQLTKKDYPTALGAIYAYERQTAEISLSKIDGLQKYYGFKDDDSNPIIKKALQFFTVHAEADKWHTEEISGLIDALDNTEQQKAKEGAEAGAKLLWQFLDGMMSYISPNATCMQ